MPRPVDPATRYIPGLDGIRAIAVLAVIAYHLGLPYSDGGLLGVAVFFTLSGFLITSLLLTEHQKTGAIDLRHFWIRRFRRLVPAVVLLLAVVVLVTALTEPGELTTRSGEALSALFYVNNWWVIARGVSYFDLFAGPGPLDHLWSLSIEEQFYLVWPLVVAGALALWAGRLRPLAVITTLVALGSFAALWLLATPGLDNTRAYEGTDTRIGGILVGALAAILLHRLSRRHDTVWAPTAALVGLIGTVLVILFSQDGGLGVFRWGIAAVSVTTALLAAGVARSGGVVGALLGSSVLRWLGERSYGLYLWHMPAVAFIPRDSLSDTAWTLVVLIVTVGVAELSWTLLEDPIRRHGLMATFRRAPRNRIRSGVPTEAALLRDLSQHARLKERPHWRPVPSIALALVAVATLTGVGRGPEVTPERVETIASDTPAESPAEDRETVFPPEPGIHPLDTSCRSVLHLGDSTSIGLMSENYLPLPADRIDAQYRQVGVADVRTEISGARSAVEGYQGEPNSTDVAAGIVAGGYYGCWVAAIGTNDAANVEAGSEVGLRERVDRTMAAIGPEQRVLWLTLKTVNPTNGYYTNDGMQRLNQEIRDACLRYPNLRVYDWDAQVRDEWFIDDGIHFSSDGYRERGRRIARALATAYPADAPIEPSCTVLPF